MLEHPILHAEVLLNLGFVCYSSTRYGESEQHLEQAARLAEFLDSSWKFRVQLHYGALLRRIGAEVEAREILESALSVRRLVGADGLHGAVARAELAETYRSLARPEQALVHAERALGYFDQKLRPNDSRLENVVLVLAHILTDLGRFDEARPLYERARAITRDRGIQLAGALHPQFLGPHVQNLARLDWRAGALDAAESGFEQAVAMMSDHVEESVRGATRGWALLELAQLLESRQRLSEAEEAYREAVLSLRVAITANSWTRQRYESAMTSLMAAVRRRNAPAELDRSRQENLAYLRQRRDHSRESRDQLPWGPIAYARIGAVLGHFLVEAGEHEEAAQVLGEACPALARHEGTRHPATVVARADLAVARNELRDGVSATRSR